jgi:hypothetical protein
MDKKGNRIAMSVGVGDKVLIPQVSLSWNCLGDRWSLFPFKKKKKTDDFVTPFSMEEVH